MFEIAWVAQFFAESFALGILIIFVLSIIGNATIFLPAPVDLMVFAAAALLPSPLHVLIMVVAAAAGAAIGEMSAYIIGLLGVTAIQKMGEKNIDKVFEMGEKLAREGVVFIFLGALTPFPFDLIGIAAGIIKYDPKRFFAAALAGKFVRFLLIGFAGYFGIGAVRAWFGV